MRVQIAAFLCIVLGSVALSPDTARAARVSVCGLVGEDVHCLGLWTVDTGESFVLPDTLDIVVPGLYHVTGESYMSSASCEPGVPNLRDVVVGPCTPDTLGCGVLGQFTSDDGDCYCWRNLPEQQVFNVLDLGGHAVGDTVVAIGVPCPILLAVGGTCQAFGWHCSRRTLSRVPTR